jgi:CheY-like chemotaxis protein
MNETILVVDDREDQREAMVDLLRWHQYTVASAGNGQEALLRLSEGASLPALILLDVEMPVMDGWEFLYHAGRDRSFRRIPVVVISGSSSTPETIVVPMYLRFIAKPVDPDALLAVIAQVLQDAAREVAPTADDGAVEAMDEVATEPHLGPLLQGDGVRCSPAWRRASVTRGSVR